MLLALLARAMRAETNTDTAPIAVPIELEDTGLLAMAPTDRLDTVPVTDRIEAPPVVAEVDDVLSTDAEATDFTISFATGNARAPDTGARPRLRLRTDVGCPPAPERPAPARRRVGFYRAITSV